jgi:prepilin-type N-terminal cleavage/methylation domain-containing protein
MRRRLLSDRSGFTLIEIICVLVLLATIASVAISRMAALDQSASRQMLRSCLSELNSRENMTWSQVKLSQAGWVDDATLFAQVNTALGSEYQWAAAPTATGGGVRFKDQALALVREASTAGKAGLWKEGS